MVNTAMIAELESSLRPSGLGLSIGTPRRRITLRPVSPVTPKRHDRRSTNHVETGPTATRPVNPVEPTGLGASTPPPPVSGSRSRPPTISHGEDFLFDLYLRDALREPLLGLEEEQTLGRRALEGDEEARQRLVLSNLRLVIRIAGGYRGYGLPVPDLISEGNLGLLRAARLFNPDMGARFATYASAWIKQRIRRALSNQSRLVRLPLGVVECLSRVRQAESRLLAELGRDPTDQELAADTELVAYLINRLRAVAHQCYVSLDAAPASASEEDGPTLAETLADEAVEAPDETLARAGDREFTRGLLATLSPREQQVLRLRYGFEGGSERSMEEVGQILGVVRQRVQQIESMALVKLRKRAHQQSLLCPAQAA